MRKKWKYKELDEEKIDEIVKKFDVPELLATVLVNRGIVDDEEIRVFLNPTRSDFHDPYLMPDMEIAVERIIKAIDNQEKVIELLKEFNELIGNIKNTTREVCYYFFDSND